MKIWVFNSPHINRDLYTFLTSSLLLKLLFISPSLPYLPFTISNPFFQTTTRNISTSPARATTKPLPP